MSVELAGYTQQPYLGGWIRESDNAGPFTIDQGMGTTGTDNWIQLPTGPWVRRDGSGPYFRDVTAGTVTAIFPAP
jgi:hypothetical protein